MKPYNTVITHDSPARAPSAHADAATPFVEAAITAGILTAIYGAAAWYWTWPAKWAVAVFLGVLLLAWSVAHGEATATRWTSKTTTPVPQRQAPPAEPSGISMAEFIGACAAGGTSERRWAGEPRYNELRDVLIGAGYAQWRNADHRQGWEMVGDAGEIADAMAWYETVAEWMG